MRESQTKGFSSMSSGADPEFQVRGGGANLKKLLGVFRVKNHDFTPKNHIFSNFRGGGNAGCPPPPGSAPDLEYLQTNDDGKSSVQLSAILRFDFFFSLVVCSHILHTVVPITVTLQSSTS